MRRLAKLAIGVAIVVAIAVFAIPNLLSTSLVKSRIADQLSRLTGRSVVIEGSSSISLRPYLGVSYDKVIFRDDRDAPNKPLITIEKLKGRLGLFAAVLGEAQVTGLEFIRPKFHLRVDRMGRRNWAPDRGNFGKYLADREGQLNLRLGTVMIVDGIVELVDEGQSTSNQWTSIGGTISWPKSSSPLNARLSAVWHGEVMELNTSVAAPSEWLRGGKSDVSLNLQSKPLTLTFDGATDQLSSRAEGVLSLASPSPKRLVDWLKIHLPAMDVLGQSSLSGRVTLRDKTLEFPEAMIDLAGHSGRGRLQMIWKDKTGLNIGGTLAFESIPFPQPQNVFLPTQAVQDDTGILNSDFLKGLGVDVRLSAKSAAMPSIEMTNIAASIIVRDGRVSFDIGQAQALGGSIAGSMNLQLAENAAAVSTNLLMNNIDLGELGDSLPQVNATFQGKGDVELKLKSSASDRAGLLLRLNGEGSVRSASGEIQGIDLSKLLQWSQGNQVSPAMTISGSTEYDELNLEFFIANGTAFLRDSYIQNANLRADLQGRVDLVRATLALRGIVQSVLPIQEKRPILPIFVGGTLWSPLIVPVRDVNRSVIDKPQQYLPTPSQ